MIRKNRFTSQKFNIVLNDNKHTHVFDLNDVFDPQNNLGKFILVYYTQENILFFLFVMIKNFKNVLDYYLFDSEYETNEYIYELFCRQILEIQNEKYVLIYDTDDEIDISNNENGKKLFFE